MATILKADIFFFVTTACVVFITIFLIILIAYFIRFVRALNQAAEKIKEKTDDLSDEVKEFLDRVSNSFLFNLLFPKKNKRSKKVNKSR